MRRKTRATTPRAATPRAATPRKKDRPPRRARGADIPEVPTFQPDPPAVSPPEETQADEAAELVRRMVEAAYT
ncbi:hypothetical protein [Rhodopila sp.]|uniref:hypothetical protein n=1 Tax=Rhodopila sp. TaxID=2480087 RepID=UPI003D0BC6F9